jgi:pimeloyl-ACP methyl ester carboxylesterase
MRAFLPLVRLIPIPVMRGAVRSELIRWFSDPIRARPLVNQCLSSWEKPTRWRQLLRQLAALNAGDMAECTRRLESLEMPVAIVASDDPAVPRVALDQVRQALPKATLDIIRDARHFSPEESPERIADVVARLLRT